MITKDTVKNRRQMRKAMNMDTDMITATDMIMVTDMVTVDVVLLWIGTWNGQMTLSEVIFYLLWSLEIRVFKHC